MDYLKCHIDFKYLTLQVGKGDRGDVTILPTLVINNRQYRGVIYNSLIFFLVMF
jgi:hypothetical protein